MTAAGRVIELPRQLVAMLLEHKARSRFKGPRDFVFCSRSGRPLGQRNALRALRLAQTKARRPDGRPTFPILHDCDERGRPVPVPRGAVPSFHSFRHSAASQAIAAGESAEEISWQLGHKDSTVTRAVYVHEIKSQERRAPRRARMEAAYGSTLEALDGSRAQQTPEAPDGEVVDLQEIRHRAQ
jgi:integrase